MGALLSLGLSPRRPTTNYSLSAERRADCVHARSIVVVFVDETKRINRYSHILHTVCPGYLVLPLLLVLGVHSVIFLLPM